MTTQSIPTRGRKTVTFMVASETRSTIEKKPSKFPLLVPLLDIGCHRVHRSKHTAMVLEQCIMDDLSVETWKIPHDG